MLRQKHALILEFIKTLKLDASHKWILVAQILPDAASPQQKVNVNACIATIIQGYISLKPQSEKNMAGGNRSPFSLLQRGTTKS